MRISDWSSDVCSSDLLDTRRGSVLSEADRELTDEIEALEQEIVERKTEIAEQNTAVEDLVRKAAKLEGQHDTAKGELEKAEEAKRAAVAAFATEEIEKLSKLVTVPGGFFGEIGRAHV